jgi:hypothetical protein
VTVRWQRSYGRRPLDSILELVERRRPATAELRILLALLDREATDAELARTFGRRSVEIRRLAAGLYARGLLSIRCHPCVPVSAGEPLLAGHRLADALSDMRLVGPQPTLPASRDAWKNGRAP